MKLTFLISAFVLLFGVGLADFGNSLTNKLTVISRELSVSEVNIQSLESCWNRSKKFLRSDVWLNDAPAKNFDRLRAGCADKNSTSKEQALGLTK